MGKCGCDDGIGQYVCEKHSTPENDPFHYIFHAKQEKRIRFEEEYPIEFDLEEEEKDGDCW